MSASEEQQQPAQERDLSISVAGSVRSKGRLEKRTRKWEQLIELHFSKSTAWRGTRAEYMKLSKPEQQKEKDIGYFVGGTFSGERRKADELETRELLTLDADYADEDFLDLLDIALPFEWAAYSTIKHSTKKPRLRLVVPLARTITPDEYEPIGRAVAAMVGIDYFDDTTFEAARAMFWPHHCRDVEPVFKRGGVGAPWADPDEILSGYPDWRDASCWPLSSRQDTILQAKKERAGDPTEKPGLVGAFCRAYGIREALATFLPDVYRPEGEERYSYAKGTTANGAVVYDDLWLYSHHGTDPARGQLLNAWDLVRVHRFATLDADTPEDTPITRRPSTQAMTDLARKDERARGQAVADKLKQAGEDFEAIEEDANAQAEGGGEEGKDRASWLSRLSVDARGNVRATMENVSIILQNHPQLRGRVVFNELLEQIEILAPLPWFQDKRQPGAWRDTDDLGLKSWLFSNFGIEVAKGTVFDAVMMQELSHTIDPVADYLRGLEWDGLERIDTMLIRHLGAADNKLNRIFSRKWLISAVARALNPGCKVDTMLLLSGNQGQAKSSLGRILAKDPSWFQDNLPSVGGNRDVKEALQGSWIVEVGELAAFRQREVEEIKVFLSSSVDRYRAAYGRHVQNRPRRCVFMGTTNEDTPLRDETGNRRFWFVPCSASPNQRELAQEVDQLWAEAVLAYQLGERWWLETNEEHELFEAREREGLDDTLDLVGLIEQFLATPVPPGWYDTPKGDSSVDFAEPTEERRWLIVQELKEHIARERPDMPRVGLDRHIARAVRKLEGWSSKSRRVRTGRRYGNVRTYLPKGES